jgi:hypothetical protein
MAALFLILIQYSEHANVGKDTVVSQLPGEGETMFFAPAKGPRF